MKQRCLGLNQKNKAINLFASDLIQDDYKSDLIGDYQEQNKKTVLQTIRVLTAETSI
jgi:dihydrofolate synthase/folylpolyglutamate synthase